MQCRLLETLASLFEDSGRNQEAMRKALNSLFDIFDVVRVNVLLHHYG